MAEKTTPDTLKKFGAEFQAKCIACMLGDKGFIERIYDILSAEYFESDANKWLVGQIMEYFVEYKSVPTLQVFKIKLDQIEDSDRTKVLKTSIVEQLRYVFTHIDAADKEFIKETFLEFCCNQKMKAAVLESTELLVLGQYDEIKKLVDAALKAGMERNLGRNKQKWLIFKQPKIVKNVNKAEFVNLLI